MDNLLESEIAEMSDAELSERMVENWWAMRAMAINMGTLIEDKMIDLRLLTDDQRAIRPRKFRRMAAVKQERIDESNHANSAYPGGR